MNEVDAEINGISKEDQEWIKKSADEIWEKVEREEQEVIDMKLDNFNLQKKVASLQEENDRLKTHNL